jgi:putative flavoprotein involved in K+ transport
VEELALAPGELRERGERHEAAEEEEPGVVAVAADDVLPCVPGIVRLEVEVVALVHASVALSAGDMREFPQDAGVNPDLLVELAREPFFQRLAGVEPPGGHLRACLGIAPLVEHEQLEPARDVCDHAKRDQIWWFTRSDECGRPYLKRRGGSLFGHPPARQPLGMKAIPRSVGVAVVGAGPAGIAASSRLARLGYPHVVFERGRIAWSWQSQRWDSFRLNTPGWANRALGKAPSSRRGAFETVDTLVAALERIAKRLPVVEGADVVSARRIGPRWHLDTTRGSVAADAVVVASGFQNVPRTPGYAALLPSGVQQLHAADYRRPGALEDGVLVVGGAQSGLQIAEDLVDAGKRVYLATSRVGRLPRRFAGRDAFEWMRETGDLDLLREEADPQMMAATPPQVAGGRTVSYQSLAGRGVTLLGRASGWHDGRLLLGADLGENVRFADDVSRRFRSAWEKRARLFARGRDVPNEADPADAPAPHLYEAPGPVSLDLAAERISTVVWATGFGPSLDWLPVDALDDLYRPELPGLHVVGAPWLTHRASANLYGMVTDADRMAAAVAAQAPVRLAA